MSWLRGLAWQQKAALGGLAIVAMILIALVVSDWGNSALRGASEHGAAIERAKTLEKTIERVEAANEVRAGIQYAPALWCEQCMRNSRTPANCRYQLPGVQDHQLCPAAARPDGGQRQQR